MTRLPPSPFISVSPGGIASSLPLGENEPSVTTASTPGESLSATPTAAPCDVSVTTAGAVAPSSASVVSNLDSAASFPAQDDAPNSAGADLQIPAPAAFSNSESAPSPLAWLDAPDAAGVGVATAAPAAISNSSSCGSTDGRAERTTLKAGVTVSQGYTLSNDLMACEARESESQIPDEFSKCGAVRCSATAGIEPGPHDSTTQLIPSPEYFSDYAHRQSMAVISPPRNVSDVVVALGAELERAVRELHPRDLDQDPPLFLRKPRPAFLRALFQLGAPQ